MFKPKYTISLWAHIITLYHIAVFWQWFRRVIMFLNKIVTMYYGIYSNKLNASGSKLLVIYHNFTSILKSNFMVDISFNMYTLSYLVRHNVKWSWFKQREFYFTFSSFLAFRGNLTFSLATIEPFGQWEWKRPARKSISMQWQLHIPIILIGYTDRTRVVH